jgi:hypothetical protein
MPYHSSFYFREKQENVLYSHKPQGSLDVGRLIKNKAPWKKINLSAEDKPKTLVLADWNAKYWPLETIAQVQRILTQLIDDAFPLYVWQQGVVERLNKENLFCLDNQEVRSKITPVFAEHIRHATVIQHQLIYDQVHVLDDHWMNVLFNKNDAPEIRRFYVGNHGEWGNKQVIATLRQATPPLAAIIEDTFPKIDNELAVQVRAEFPELSVVTQYKTLNLMRVKTLVEQNDRMVLDGVTFTAEELQEINYLEYRSYHALPCKALLKATPNLKGLFFSDMNDQVLDYFTEYAHIESIEWLRFEQSDLSGATLHSFLVEISALRVLYLEGCALNSVDQIALNHLEVLNVTYSDEENVPIAVLEQLLVSAPHLKKLELNDSTNLSGYLNKVSLARLETLNVQDSNVSTSVLQGLIAEAKHLKILNLSKCKNLTGSFDAIELQDLELIDLQESTLSAELLLGLLAKATKLKTLNLYNCTVTGLSHVSGAMNLHCLETLTLRLSTIPASIMQSILANATHLKNLDLGYKGISTAELQWILTKVPNLHVLKVNHCDKAFASSFSENIYLPKLQELYFASSGLTEKHVQQVHCPDETKAKILKLLSLHHQSLRAQLPHSIDSSESMDADTSYNPYKKHHVARIFHSLDPNLADPNVTDYRLKTFNASTINSTPCALFDAFRLHNEGEAELTPIRCLEINTMEQLITIGQGRMQEEPYVLGRKKLELTSEWQALPSLSANEILTHYYISRVNPIEIQYSRRDQLYYARCKSVRGTHYIDFAFLMHILPAPTVVLPAEIAAVVDDFKQFGIGALALDEQPQLTGYDYLQRILTQRKGSCRHRALAFKALLQTTHPHFPVRVVLNECHAFVEIKVKQKWIQCDLGGYPAELIIDELPDSQDENDTSQHEGNNTTQKTDEQTSQNSAVVESRWVVEEKDEVNRERGLYEQQLATWNKTSTEEDSVMSYCQRVVQSGATEKRLIELVSRYDVYALQLSLQHYCQKTSRPYFYVREPDDLICSAPYVARNENQGTLISGPGGPLHTFLQANQETHTSPVLIVNYDPFDADDIVRFNELLDKIRKADGTLLPSDALVVGLINTHKPGCYQGADFYSRFDLVEINPLPADVLATHVQNIAPLGVRDKSSNEATAMIALYHASDWEERLLGRWEIRNNGLYFVEGQLPAALATGLPIELHHGLWSDERFRLFWQQARVRGFIEHAGRRLDVSSSLQLIATEGYPWSMLMQNMTFTVKPPADARVLNPSLLSDFFSRYECQANHILNTFPGWIEKHAHGSLPIYLTRSLNEDEWAMFLSMCQQHDVWLILSCAPGTQLPESWSQKYLPKPPTMQTVHSELSPSTMAIVSSDLDTTLNQLTQQQSWCVLDVSECDNDHLLLQTQAQVDPIKGHMRFHQTQRVLLNALERHEAVILKGHFSEELVDALAPLLLQRQHSAQGTLILLSEHPLFQYLDQYSHVVSIQEKCDALSRMFPSETVLRLPEEKLAKESLAQLSTRLYYLQQTPNALSSDEAWYGLDGLSGGVILHDFNLEHSEAIAKAFQVARLEKVNRILANGPYVFLTGLTAVGKSTFVEKSFKTSPMHQLYQGETNVRSWAVDKSAKQKILFIDEANLSRRQWSEFEGLFNTPPGILIDGEYYPLTAQHKVIFAGNPVNYGDERQLAPFFVRHGRSLIFEPMPQEFIYENLLKPVFAQSDLAADVSKLCVPLLAVYRFLCECSADQILISPRELQMMALLVLSYTQQQFVHPDDRVAVAQYYAYHLASTLVPESHRFVFNQKFACKDLLPRPITEPLVGKDFLITPSRLRIHQHLNDVLALQQLRKRSSDETQQYGGLGGLILEGEPGVGKSELLIASLLAQGYHEVKAHEANSVPTKAFYKMSVSMPLAEKRTLLLRAFDEGAVVVIDEINSSPMMERLLNDLLMGKTPEGKRPTTPGFLVIGTQNPVTMAGRRAPSHALARRLMTLVVPPYKTEEMISILIASGLKEYTAAVLVDAYENNLEKSQQEHLAPPPTFRDLLKLAKQLQKAQVASTNQHIHNNATAQKPTSTTIFSAEATLSSLLPTIGFFSANSLEEVSLPLGLMKQKLGS